MKTKIYRLLALVLAVALMANHFVLPGLAADTVKMCECDEETREGTLLYSQAATCLMFGVDTYECNKCGEQYIVVTENPLGHDIKVTEAQAPTCTEIGWNEYETCSRCDYTTYAELAALGHDDSGEPVFENEVPPVCNVPGSYDVVLYCTRCPEELSRETKPIDALECIPGEIVIENEVAGNCTTPKSWDEFTYCTVCGEEWSREHKAEPAPDHQYDNGVVVQDQTCVDPEKTMYTCTVCGYELTQTTKDPAGHTYGEATCLEPETCTVCGEVKPGSTPKGHKMSEATCIELSTCSVCGYQEGGYAAHTPSTHKNYLAPTCVAEGHTVEIACAYCGLVMVESEPIPIDPEAHKPVVDPAVAATCTETGLTEGSHCELCGKILVPQEEVPATGHTEAKPVEENRVEPTCTETGSYDSVVYCATCKTVELSREKDIVIPELGHNLKTTKAKAPTCTAIGWNEYVTCSRCDYTTYVELPALGHDEYVKVENNVDPTCTEAGSYDNVTYCARTGCGKKLATEHVVVEALGHDKAESLGYTDATCTENIYEKANCGRCHEEFSIEMEGTALGHDEYTVQENVIPATCTVDGSHDDVTYCARECCKDAEGNDKELNRVSAVDPALNHPGQTIILPVEPTCTSAGRGQMIFCVVCDTYLTPGLIIPPLEHDWQPKLYCDEVEHCANCGETRGEATEHTVVPATFDSEEYCSTCGKILAPALSEQIEFTYKASGINGANVAVNSGYVTVEIYMNVLSEQARLWGVELGLEFNENLSLVSTEGCILEVSASNAYANNKLKLSQDMNTSSDKTFAKGEYLFATLTFKVDKSFVYSTADFLTITDDCLVARSRDNQYINELIATFGESFNISVVMLGDSDGDGKITNLDTMALSNWFATNGAELDAYEAIYDMNKDGYIDGDDFALMRGAVVYDNSYLDI